VDEMLAARTLAEAQTYFALMRVTPGDSPDEPAPALADPPQEPNSTLAGTTRVEGPEEWILTYGTEEEGQIQLTVPYGSEDVARRFGAVFGLGVSPLVDAGQWVLVARTHARRALEGDLTMVRNRTPEHRRRVELSWEFAAAAVGEALKFLPDGATEVPPEGFWSALGVRARADNPEWFTRAQLQDDYEYYTGTLEDFRALHGPAE